VNSVQLVLNARVYFTLSVNELMQHRDL